jgi:hypothetical protein
MKRTLRPIRLLPLLLAVSPPRALAESWYERIELNAFADAHLSHNGNNPKGTGDGFWTHPRANGFSLAWAGLDLEYPARPVGATIELRAGPMAGIHGGGDADLSLHYLKQAYASWKPCRLQIDAGKFSTIFGYEVPEAHKNFNHTRGLVYYWAQPIFHTGLRASLDLDAVKLTALAVNGWDHTVDNNDGKSFGLQVGFTPDERLSLFLGYLTGPEQDDTVTVTCAAGSAYSASVGRCLPDVDAPGEQLDVSVDGANGRFRHLVDLFLEARPVSDLTLAFNLDLVFEAISAPEAGVREDHVKWFGMMAAARYRLAEWLAAALRLEYLADPDGQLTGHERVDIYSGTLTLEVRAGKHLFVRAESRLDIADRPLLPRGTSELAEAQVTTLLGVVATTN